jgi:hypothetical protein
MVTLGYEDMIEFERRMKRNRTDYKAYGKIVETGVVVRYPSFQSNKGLGFATGEFNRLLRGIDKTDYVVIRYLTEKVHWYFVIPTNQPEMLEGAILETYESADSSMDAST